MIYDHENPIGAELTADFVIVGAGPGGASVARELTAGGASVVMLEDGPGTRHFRPSFANVARYHMQEAGTILAEGPVTFPVAAGRGVGGGSLINSAICFRAPDYVMQEWAAELADDRYRPEAVAPIYAEIEERIGVVDLPLAIAGENNLIVARGVKKLGLGGGLLRRNTPGCIGCGICNLGCPTGGKHSVDMNLI
ncbi:MAG: GMC family oxidoreductase N-terminal domain-containing protein, partial [Pirellulales bacterium]|nr:GMC family oxidoreductase N-terminal domain-containing protein [Pirellulales bacterium]